MDSEWSLWRFFDSAIEALSSRKTFMNVDPAVYHYLYCVIILAKSCVAGYGMLHVLPKRFTYPFVCVQFLLHLFVRVDWTFCYREFCNLIAHIGIIEAIESYQSYTPSFPNILVWYYNCSFNPSEFFLDVYAIIVVCYAIGDSYRTRPHKLSTMVCVLFGINWLADYFSSGPPTDTFYNLLFFYVPQLLMDWPGTENELHAFPQACAALWVCLKLAHADLEQSRAGRFVDYLNIRDWTFEDYLDAVGSRKSFLNVDEKEHFILFYVLLLSKSVLASYSARYLIGVFPTLRLLFVNFLFSLCDRSAWAVLSSFVRSWFLGLYQYALQFWKFPLSLSAGIWYFVCCDSQFHFLLDFYLIVSVLVFVDNAYRGTEMIYSLLWCLYLVDWLADAYVGRPFSTVATVATLYVPVALLSSCTRFNARTRIVSMLAYIVLWLVYKQEKDLFDDAFNKYILNFRETSLCLVASVGDAFS